MSESHEHAAAHDHGHDAHGGHGNSPEEIRKEVRGYIAVLIALAALTALTVGVTKLHMQREMAIAVALIIATVKGSLVAAFFMHLISEKKLIYAVLILTVFFFGVLMWGPWHQRRNAKETYETYERGAIDASQKTTTATQTGSH